MTAIIHTHPELNRIAVKHSIDASYIVWCVLRYETQKNNLSGHYTKSWVRSIVAEYGLTYTKRHLNRVLKQGDGLLWGLGYGMLHIRSFKRVYQALADEQAIINPSANFIKISVHKSSLARRATLYHSWFIHRGEITIARDSIKELFNLSHDQQRAYEKYLGDAMLIKTNYCHIDAETFNKNPRTLPAHAYTFKSEKFENDTVSDRLEIAYQIPNTFIAREMHNDPQSANFAPRRALMVARMLYRRTECLYQQKRYCYHIDLYDESLGKDVYIRTYYQGKKRINRIGHYI